VGRYVLSGGWSKSQKSIFGKPYAFFRKISRNFFLDAEGKTARDIATDPVIQAMLDAAMQKGDLGVGSPSRKRRRFDGLAGGGGGRRPCEACGRTKHQTPGLQR
jgi:hypothetical protein